MRYSEHYWKEVWQAWSSVPEAGRIFRKTILVTGGTGMLCSAVIDMLHELNKSKGADVRLILAGRSEKSIRERFPGFSEIEYVPFDALSPEKLTADGPIDYVIHGASIANPAMYAGHPSETLLANILGTRAALELAGEKGARLLYVSSSEVYGRKESKDLYRESDYGYVDILNPRAAYPNGKRAAETLCASYGDQFGTDTVIVRPGHVYGPGVKESDTRASADFSRRAARGEAIIMKSAGAQLRSYCYALDCASALITVLIAGKSGEAYNISNRDSVVSIRDMAEALAKAGGVEVRFENPSDLEKKGYNLMDNSGLDASKLEALGWKACFSLAEGAKSTVEGLKNEQ